MTPQGRAPCRGCIIYKINLLCVERWNKQNFNGILPKNDTYLLCDKNHVLNFVNFFCSLFFDNVFSNKLLFFYEYIFFSQSRFYLVRSCRWVTEKFDKVITRPKKYFPYKAEQLNIWIENVFMSVLQ